MKLYKYQKLLYLLCLLRSPSNSTYNYAAMADNRARCGSPIAKNLLLCSTLLCAIGAFFLGFIASKQLNITYSAIFDNYYNISVLCNDSLEYTNLYFQNSLPLYSSSECVDDNHYGIFIALSIHLLYIGSSFITNLIRQWSNNNKIVNLIQFILHKLLWCVMAYMTIVTILWITFATDNNVDISPATNLCSVFNLSNSSLTEDGTSIVTSISPNISEGLRFDLSSVNSIYSFPTGYSCPFVRMVETLTQTIEYVQQNNISAIFNPNYAFTSDTYVLGKNCTIKQESFTLLNSTYTSNLPEDAYTIVNTLGLVMAQSVLLITAFVISVFTCARDILRFKDNLS